MPKKTEKATHTPGPWLPQGNGTVLHPAPCALRAAIAKAEGRPC